METIQVMFDELTAMASEQLSLGPGLQSMTPATSIVAPRTVEIASSPSSTTIDLDAPSSNPCHEHLYDVSTSQELSSNVQSFYSPLELIGRCTKDHPLANVIGDSSRPVSTRKQLETDAMRCYFDAFLTSVIPNKFKQAILEPSWIDAMQEEIHEI
ncbi:hypothetical protein Tco_1320766 [Tanacetum coccineum]